MSIDITQDTPVLKKGLFDKEIFEDMELLKIQFYKKSNNLKIILKSPYQLDVSKEKEIKSIIQKELGLNFNIELVCYKDIKNASLEDVITTHWVDLMTDVVDKMPVFKDILISGKKSVNGNKIEIHYGNEFMCKMIKRRKFNEFMKNSIEGLFGIQCGIDIIYDESLKEKDYIKSTQKENITMIEKAFKNVDITKKPSKQSTANKSTRYNENGNDYSNENVILGRNITEDSVPIESLDQTSGVVTVLGDIFKSEVIETKTGKKIVTFALTDYTSSITVKCFLRPKDTERVLENIKTGLHCKIKGEVTNDPYAKEIVIMVRNIVKVPKIERMDTNDEKRVELHLHSTMSAMDAITPIGKLVERAAKWGHKAIAITDHGVVQAYPEAMEAGKKHGIKIIYGVEGYLVDNGIPIVEKEKGQNFKDIFVVFDLETTGFSSKNDSIIEIGAVKIKEGKIIDRFSEFVNPKRIIPSKIVELTSITDDMVRDSDYIEDVLPRFMNFAGDAVLVAHNAPFDISFIRKNCGDMNIKLNNSVLDTIPLARFLYPELKRYKLNVVAKHLGISLDNHHRAIDDAKATADILIKGIEDLEEKGIFNLNDLNDEFLKNVNIKKQPTYHIILLAKNQVGIKNLYKLISEAHLDNFFKHPRLPKTLISKYREGLIVGSACEAGEIYRAILEGKNDEELERIADFYDYLEIQPLENNEFLIRNGRVKDKEELIQINKKICELAKKKGKIVVATGDVHFLEPRDEVFRRIIMAGQGFSDADNQPPLYFRTTTEMLREFSYLGEEKSKEVVIYNTQKISDIIEYVKPIPDETFPPKIDGAEEEVKTMTLKRAHDLYGDELPEVVQKRLDKELNSIISNGYAVLYLIAHKLVAKSLEDGYLVGSRGSVGSSLVATMCDITEVNGLPPHYVCPKCKHSEFILDGSISSGVDLPDKNCEICESLYIKDGHDIPFETFLGFEGDKEPDIDLNFSGEYQAVVHKYTEVLFGKGYVFKAGTIGTIAEKTAYGFVRKYLAEKDIMVTQAEIDRLTLGCTGIKRTTGQHPGGIMVVPRDNEIFNFTPIQHPADDNSTDIITTHFDYHSISGRLLKLDILGHDDPTVLRMLQDLTGIDPKSVPLNDKKVMSLFTSTEALGLTKEQLGCEVGTYGLPEFGTKFVRQMLIDTQPQTFADLVRISGLSHGTDVWVNNAQYYIKEGFTTLKDCISTRDDIMIYLMHKNVPPKIAFTIMEKVRKGKGLKEEDIKVMKENNVPDWYIESCEKIKYMFPKGHAAAYVMMAVRIAYFKVYYPEAYYATYFTVRADDFDADLIIKGEEVIKAKISEIGKLGNNLTQKDKGLLTILELSYEMYKRNITFLKVDLYKSHPTKFLIEEDGIRPPLNGLQGVGDNAAKSIATFRNDGEFISKEDLRTRTKVSKTVIETLSVHGCLRGLPETNQLSLFTL
ncbi:PolC-type DNA polymerase III [Clostridium algidicarnis]|uniref:DNA polymerase III PolC-type n=1 Tax=Clostridium algidicarnis TaxID=37659 RepID=A0ABS6C3M1_9CLOT|nr:PolC-type DNA polymerase III [Clostridium algidicarnis]MBB6630199.1 PolC-type DNA polymerase III [Clostridium algidicarnis]MBU3192980.1 PolC-type DNA polymerase III [Clostridium algidicarnis]MBU3203418.1 PolC-type DNA polymerase III [Clostridium algidicarnis]MBU3211572.1 PolC-type DNA polymerase III [Clostridium algidicarnis]MBU3220091.1 PolC-type DNA polymerase III [Clostridium algidicarnis]